MIEYGHGIGEVSGRTGGGAGGGGSADFGANAAAIVSDTIDRVAALPPEGLLLLGVLILGGLLVLKRAF